MDVESEDEDSVLSGTGCKMLCAFPHMDGVIPFPCGQCLECRINKQRQKTLRLLLEASCHEENAFLTLTLNDEHYPINGTVSPKEWAMFLDRLRKRLAPRRIRFFAVGEYGEKNERAHYHAILFNYPQCYESGFKGRGKKCPCPSCVPVRNAWIDTETKKEKGYITLDEVNSDTAQYVCKYINKGRKNANDETTKGWLGTRNPEFNRQSSGLGRDATKDIVKALSSGAGKAFIDANGDIPTVLQIAGRGWPLDRYLKHKIRKELGFYDKQTGEITGNVPKEKIFAYAKDMSELFKEISENAPKKYEKTFEIRLHRTLRLLETTKQKRENRLKRLQIFSKEGQI